MRILIDTNIVLDIIQKREPFFADSYQALRKAIEADAECLISASAATDIFYMLRKAFQSVICFSSFFPHFFLIFSHICTTAKNSLIR